MKKLLAIVLCLVMLLSLAACSDDTTDATEADTTAAPETTTDGHDHEEITNAESEQAEDTTAAEAHDHNHINYRGRTEYFDEKDLAEIEGREWDFVYEQGEYNIYVYNELTIDEMNFTQVQFTFNGTTARVSATYSANTFLTEEVPSDEEIKKDTEEKLASFKQTLTAMYGEGSEGEQHGSTYTSWRDHTGNYIILTRINESTVQVAYYIGTATEG